MAAQEYYASFNQRPQQGPPHASTPGPPPSYTASTYHQSSQPFGIPPAQQPYVAPPQPWNPRQGYSYPPPAAHNHGHPPQRPHPAPSQSNLMPPLHPHRSHSEPPDSRRVSPDEPHKHKNKHHHHRSASRSRSRSRPRSSRAAHSHHSHSHSHSHRTDDRPSGRPRARSRARSDRDTFLGAGGGAILGDTLVPGLGTLGGALLGALGGNKYAGKKSKSDHERRKYKDGITVHSRWGSDR